MREESLYRGAMRGLRGLAAGILPLCAAEAWLTIRLPWLMSETVDRAVARQDAALLGRLITRMLLCAAAGSLLGFVIMALCAVLAQRYGHALRTGLLRRVMGWSWERSAGWTSGTLLTRVVSDTQILSEFPVTLLQTVVRPGLFILLAVLSIARIDPAYLWVLLPALPAEAGLLWLFLKKLRPRFAAIQRILERTNAWLQRMLSSLRFIRVNRGTEREEKRYGGLNGELYETSLEVQRLLAIMNPLLIFILNMAIIATLLTGARLTGQPGSVGAGSVLAAIMYLQQLLMCLLTVGQFFQSLSRFRISRERVEEIWQGAGEEGSGEQEPERGELSLALEGAGYRYPGAREDALSDMDLTLRPGARLAVVGPTGSGKSTLCRVLCGMLPATAGRVLLGGREPEKWPRRALRQRVVLVPQTAGIMTGTVEENLRFGLEEPGEEALWEAARVAQAEEMIRSLPRGLQTPLAEGGASLSGGQRQCIALARALLRRPEVLILDDGCSAMDFRTEAKFREALREWAPGMTLVYVSNRMPTVRDAEEILVLEGGRTADRGRHEELLGRCAFYRTACEAQGGGREA